MVKHYILFPRRKINENKDHTITIKNFKFNHNWLLKLKAYQQSLNNYLQKL